MVESTTASNPSRGAESNENSYGWVLEYASALGPTVRELTGSGAYSALGGVVTFGRGLQSLRRGETGRGLWRLAVGGLFVGIAVAQRRSATRRSGEDDTRGEDYTDVLGGGSDVEDVETRSNTSRGEDDYGTTVDDTDTDETDIDDDGLATTGVHGPSSDDREPDTDETADGREEANTGDGSERSGSEARLD